MIQQINIARNVLIISHMNPDGDTLGSMCALNLVLKGLGKKTTMLIHGICPQIYKFLPSVQEAQNITESAPLTENFDLAITLDVASIDRISESARRAFRQAKTTICIDHHETNKGFADYNLIAPNASSTGEVLYGFLKEEGFEINKEIATCLYVAILTDTGGFKYESTKAETLSVASNLIESGVNPTEIFRLCYESKAKEMVLFQAFCIANAVFGEKNKIAYSLITKDLMKKFNAKNEHTDGICEALRQIDTVEISLVFKEVDSSTTKVSLRSKNVSVSEIAEKFGGGGHKFAAGCTVQKPLNIAKDKLLEVICQKKA